MVDGQLRGELTLRRNAVDRLEHAVRYRLLQGIGNLKESGPAWGTSRGGHAART